MNLQLRWRTILFFIHYTVRNNSFICLSDNKWRKYCTLVLSRDIFWGDDLPPSFVVEKKGTRAKKGATILYALTCYDRTIDSRIRQQFFKPTANNYWILPSTGGFERQPTVGVATFASLARSPCHRHAGSALRNVNEKCGAKNLPAWLTVLHPSPDSSFLRRSSKRYVDCLGFLHSAATDCPENCNWQREIIRL